MQNTFLTMSNILLRPISKQAPLIIQLPAVPYALPVYAHKDAAPYRMPLDELLTFIRDWQNEHAAELECTDSDFLWTLTVKGETLTVTIHYDNGTGEDMEQFTIGTSISPEQLCNQMLLEVRESLYDICNTWYRNIDSNDPRFSDEEWKKNQETIHAHYVDIISELYRQ